MVMVSPQLYGNPGILSDVFFPRSERRGPQGCPQTKGCFLSLVFLPSHPAILIDHMVNENGKKGGREREENFLISVRHIVLVAFFQVAYYF